MRAEVQREGRWSTCSSWRLQRSIHHHDDRLELRGYYGGPIAPPWRVLDDAGTTLVSSSDDERRSEERRSLVETDESPTTDAHSSGGSRTT